MMNSLEIIESYELEFSLFSKLDDGSKSNQIQDQGLLSHFNQAL